MDTSHTYVRMHTHMQQHIVCYGYFATLLMGSHGYSMLLLPNGSVLPNLY